MCVNERVAARRFVILEPDVEGHTREWLKHLLRSAAALAPETTVWFAVAPELEAELTEVLPRPLRNGIRIVSLEAWEKRLCASRVLALSAFGRWWVMRKYLRQLDADAGHFLSLDHLSLPFALGLGVGGKRVSGILFRPSVHYGAIGAYRPRFGERLRDMRKAILYRLMLLNGSVGTVLTLDPYFPEYAKRHYQGGIKVRALPDPVHPAVAKTPDDTDLADLIPDGRVSLVLFGYLARRKGVLALLDALARLRPDIARRIAVVLAGRIDPDIHAEICERRERLAALQPELWLRAMDRRLSDGEIDALVRRAAIVLAPYQRFVGSSGVLLWAARAGRPILTQEFGLLGRLVRDHDLGLALDASDPSTLARGIERMIESGSDAFINRRAALRFAEEHTPQRFASMVFASLFEE